MPADFKDRTDFENSDRGFIARLDPMVIKAADGRVVWDMNWGFLELAVRTPRTPACGGRRSSPRGTGCMRWLTGSTRSGASRCRT